MIEFVTASHSPEVLEKNLKASEMIKQSSKLIVQTGYDNVAKAYNEAPLKGKKGIDIVVYVHHDVFLPADFALHFMEALKHLETLKWGVAGPAGVIFTKNWQGNKYPIGWIRDRGNEWGRKMETSWPCEVDTLDELMLITRGDYVFDERLPQDFYGADICMQAKRKGKKSYGIQAYCHHNSSRPFGGRTQSFYESLDYFAAKWADYLPVATTCTIVK